jgi:hypothetical protein
VHFPDNFMNYGSMRLFRLACCQAMILLVATCLPHFASASPVIVIVKGTVSSGTDGNPDSRPPGAGKVFGRESNLAGKPFALTLNLDTLLGTSSFARCPDGTISQSSNTKLVSNPTAYPSAVLQIGKGSYPFAAHTLVEIFWIIRREARTQCASFNEVAFGWSETYTGKKYTGGAGFSGNPLYASPSVHFSGDWRTSIPTTPIVKPVDLQFSIELTQAGTLANIAYARGSLKTATVAVVTSSTCPLADSPGKTGLGTSEPDTLVDCHQKLADLAGALQSFENQLNPILAIERRGGTPDKEQLKALDEAAGRLENALKPVITHCDGTAAAATLIARAEAALEQAAPFLPYSLCL